MFKSQLKSPPRRLELLFAGTAVGELTRLKDGSYRFQYLPAFVEMKLAALPGLSMTGEHVSRDLFPFFAERIPELRRPEVREWLRQHQVDDSDQMTLLESLGKRSVTDSYELKAA
jgi:HipA-like protein